MGLGEPVELHPDLTEVYSRKVAELTTALNVEGIKTEAAELLRSLLCGIRLIPDGTALAIELTGEFVGITALGKGRKTELLPGAGVLVGQR